MYLAWGSKNILNFGLRDQLFLGAGRPKVKPLENALCKRGSMKEEAQRSLAHGQFIQFHRNRGTEP